MGPRDRVHTGDTGAQWPVVTIQRVAGGGPGVMTVALAALQNSAWSPHYNALPRHCPYVISSLHPGPLAYGLHLHLAPLPLTNCQRTFVKFHEEGP